jgi:hypothetical protein
MVTATGEELTFALRIANFAQYPALQQTLLSTFGSPLHAKWTGPRRERAQRSGKIFPRRHDLDLFGRRGVLPVPGSDHERYTKGLGRKLGE